MFLKIKFLNEITIILIKLLFFDNTFKHHIIENQIQDVFLRKNLTESKRNSDAGSHGYCSTDYGVCARYKNVKFSLYPRLGFSQKASWSRWTSPKTERGERWGKRFFMSRCHGTPTIDACHNLVQLLLPLYSSHVHMVHGAMTAPCNIEASSSLDCSKLKTDEIVPIFTGGPGNPAQDFPWNGMDGKMILGSVRYFIRELTLTEKFLIKNLGRRSS